MNQFAKRCTLLCIAIGTALLSSCADPSAWYPDGNAKIVSVLESTGTGKQCVCSVSIRNEGRAKIYRSTVSVSIVTDSREYFATAVSDTGILPGGTVYMSVAVPYLSDTETIIAGGARITDEFYE